MFDAKIAAQAVENFLGNSVIQEVFREMKMRYFERWLRSNDPADRERIFAECRAFDSLGVALQAVADSGLHEDAQKDLERRSQ